jgi:hypothetical protein
MSDKYYRTKSLYLATFLLAKNFSLVDITKQDGVKDAVFVFENSSELLDSVEAYNFGKEDVAEVRVDMRKYIAASKLLKDKLYQDEL